jgi:hypothetical protein
MFSNAIIPNAGSLFNNNATAQNGNNTASILYPNNQQSPLFNMNNNNN